MVIYILSRIKAGLLKCHEGAFLFFCPECWDNTGDKHFLTGWSHLLWTSHLPGWGRKKKKMNVFYHQTHTMKLFGKPPSKPHTSHWIFQVPERDPKEMLYSLPGAVMKTQEGITHKSTTAQGYPCYPALSESFTSTVSLSPNSHFLLSSPASLKGRICTFQDSIILAWQ